MDIPPHIFQAFTLPPVQAVSPIGSGLLHATYHVVTAAGSWVLQKLHPAIPDAAVEDMQVVTSYLASCGLRVPLLVRTRDAQPLARDASGGRWRLYAWIAGQVVEAVPHAAMAYEAGHLVGRLHRALAGLAYQPRGSIPHFHETAVVLAELRQVAVQLPVALRQVAEAILTDLPALIIIDNAPQLIHGDLKISNLIFDQDGHAIGLIDFDTILLQARAIDLGDALRSWCNRTAEDDPQACFDLSFFDAAVQGYAEGAHAVNTAAARQLYRRATRQMALELSARFLIDVVRDSYFGFDATRYPNRRAHNTARALGQYHLAGTIPRI
ncbi:MAG: phosphotransferase enzyme family protein [Candidatus Tectimicrobiota bacterium]